MAVQPTRGMRDILPADARNRLEALRRIREVFAGHGFSEIETPAMEPIERLTSGQGGDNEKMLYRVMKRGVPEHEPSTPAELAELGLRFDLTVPLARFMASNAGELPPVFKSIQIGPVWRAERPQKGRFRQFVQCDVDICGDPTLAAEIEVVDVVSRAVLNVGFDSLTVRVNDRRLLTSLMNQCGIAPELHDSALISLDKLDKIGLDGVLTELRDKVQVPAEHVDAVAECLHRFQALPDRSDFAAVGAILTGDATTPLVSDLALLAKTIHGLHGERVKVEFDLTLVRGMGYYTGPIFELAHPDFSGAIGGGGRYDGMIGRFSGRDIPACGFSIGFERVALIMESLLATDRRLVLFYGGLEELPQAMAQRELLLRGATELGVFAEVQVVNRPKRPKATLDALQKQGYTHVAHLDNMAGCKPLGDSATSPSVHSVPYSAQCSL